MKHLGKITPPAPGEDASLDQSVLSRLAALKALSVRELKAEWETLMGSSAPNNSRTFLETRIAYRIQELSYGGPDRETRRMLPRHFPRPMMGAGTGFHRHHTRRLLRHEPGELRP